MSKVDTRTDTKGGKQPTKKSKRKLTAFEIDFHEKREQRTIKLRDDWLADHPGKTVTDAEIAVNSAATHPKALRHGLNGSHSDTTDATRSIVQATTSRRNEMKT